MKLRTFTAASMHSAMAEAKRTLGEDAIILSSSTAKDGTVTLTAAVEDEREKRAAPPPPKAPMPPGNSAWMEELASLLRWHGVPEPLAGRLVYKARHLELDALFALQKLAKHDGALLETKALSRLFSAAFRFTKLPMDRGARLMIVGPPGIGKTVAVAKIATQLALDKANVVVITTDNKRAGGVEQLAAFTNILELPLREADSPKRLAAVLGSADKHTHVLIDTAGCNVYEHSEMEELAELINVGGFEPVLALPAGMDSFEAADAARAFAFPPVSKLLITRGDAARRFGSLLSAADAGNLAFAAIGNSPRVVGEIKPLDAAVLAQSMLQYRENR